jgi:hypothetical protein
MADGVTIGVALSGGGAAAMAHVGVLEELAAAGIAIDRVAGTSAGALVGAAYAADYLEPFRETMCALTRRRVLWLFDPTWPHSGLLEGRRRWNWSVPSSVNASNGCHTRSRQWPPICNPARRSSCGTAASSRRFARALQYRGCLSRNAGKGVG